MAHKLFEQLMAANVADDEIAELYTDLQDLFENTFDELINEAVNKRGCVNVNPCNDLPN